MWWVWIVGGLAAWLAVAFLVAVVLGRGIRLADRRSLTSDPDLPLTTADLPAGLRASIAPAPARVRRRAVPLPPVGVALAAVAVALETTGFLLELTGAAGTAARVLSMDAPGSLPRLFVALLFALAAVAAVAGAARAPSRRAWWLGVGLAAGGVAAVKAGSTVHVEGMDALGSVVGDTGALLLSAALAAGVVGGLWYLSRTERRDRRRVLGVLALYAVASVGLSAISSSVGSSWAVTATYVEESAEALAGVAFLVAVLVGVAPRLVLPASWALRRAADAQALEVPQPLPGRPSVEGPGRS